MLNCDWDLARARRELNVPQSIEMNLKKEWHGYKLMRVFVTLKPYYWTSLMQLECYSGWVARRIENQLHMDMQHFCCGGYIGSPV